MDRGLCDSCGKCVAACPSKAMQMQGTMQTVEDVIKTVMLDEPFYRNSRGGVTVSGGEPLMQAEFTAAIFRRSHELHLTTCVETTGFSSWEKLALVAEHTDHFLYDIKHMNSQKHKEGTGVGNECILQNLNRLSQEFPDADITIRTPVIPHYNDTIEDIGAIAEYLAPLKAVHSYKLLPFHTYGESKYEALGRVYDVPKDERISKELLKELEEAADLTRYR